MTWYRSFTDPASLSTVEMDKSVMCKLPNPVLCITVFAVDRTRKRSLLVKQRSRSAVRLMSNVAVHTVNFKHGE